MNLLTIKNMTAAYNDKVLFDNVDFSVNDREKIGIIGINGCGKSTLLKIIAGIGRPDSGSVTKGNNVHIRYLAQAPDFPEGITIFEYVLSANTHKEDGWDMEGEAKSILNRLGFMEYDITADKLSGGEKKRVALAAALLSRADILVLDEPTNHLDVGMIQWLEDYLKGFKGSLVMVTHDRYFLDRVTNRIVEIHRGKLYLYQTNYQGFLEQKALREEQQEAAQSKRRNILRRELEWMKRGAKARSTKQKARLDRIDKMLSEETEKAAESAKLSSVYTRMGKKTIELEHIVKQFDGRRIIDDFSYIFLRDQVVAFTGINGCGKSTLMKIIAGEELPDSGEVVRGDTIRIGYFAQDNSMLDDKQRVIDCIKDVAEFVKTPEGSISASMMLERFLFNSTLQYTPIGKLSGGEKRRLYLIKVLMGAPNVLILDEPTNDLDVQTLSILEDYIENFSGITVIVSHDRFFLDRVCERLFVFKGDGRIEEEIALSPSQVIDGMASVADAVTSDAGQSQPKGSWNKGEKPLKFSYQEQKEYETIEADIEELEDRIASIDKEMMASATDFVRLNSLAKEKDNAREKLEYKYTRWEYLSNLAEQIEADKIKRKAESR